MNYFAAILGREGSAAGAKVGRSIWQSCGAGRNDQDQQHEPPLDEAVLKAVAGGVSPRRGRGTRGRTRPLHHAAATAGEQYNWGETDTRRHNGATIPQTTSPPMLGGNGTLSLHGVWPTASPPMASSAGRKYNKENCVQAVAAAPLAPAENRLYCSVTGRELSVPVGNARQQQPQRDLGPITLHCFDCHHFLGRAGKIRVYLSIRNIQHNIVAVLHSAWESVRARLLEAGTSPLGTLPALVHSAQGLCETNTILRYLARLYGDYGKKAQLDSVHDMVIDRAAYWQDELMNSIWHWLAFLLPGDGPWLAAEGTTAAQQFAVVKRYLMNRKMYYDEAEFLISFIGQWCPQDPTNPPLWTDCAFFAIMHDDLTLCHGIRALLGEAGCTQMVLDILQDRWPQESPEQLRSRQSEVFRDLFFRATEMFETYPRLAAVYDKILAFPSIRQMLRVCEIAFRNLDARRATMRPPSLPPATTAQQACSFQSRQFVLPAEQQPQQLLQSSCYRPPPPLASAAHHARRLAVEPADPSPFYHVGSTTESMAGPACAKAAVSQFPIADANNQGLVQPVNAATTMECSQMQNLRYPAQHYEDSRSVDMQQQSEDDNEGMMARLVVVEPADPYSGYKRPSYRSFSPRNNLPSVAASPMYPGHMTPRQQQQLSGQPPVGQPAAPPAKAQQPNPGYPAASRSPALQGAWGHRSNHHHHPDNDTTTTGTSAASRGEDERAAEKAAAEKASAENAAATYAPNATMTPAMACGTTASGTVAGNTVTSNPSKLAASAPSTQEAIY